MMEPLCPSGLGDDIAARVEGLDVLLLEPLVGIAVVVPIVVIISKRESSQRSELDFFHAERSPHVHSTIRVDLDDLARVPATLPMKMASKNQGAGLEQLG